MHRLEETRTRALILCLAASIGCGDDSNPATDMFTPGADAELPTGDAGPSVLDCSPLFDGESTALVAFDTCDALGGERVCYLQQEECGLEVWCDGSMVSGEVLAGRVASFTMDGSECTARLEGGRLVGSCTTGTEECAIEAVDPVPGAIECPVVPSLDFRTRGCGSASIACLEAVQHGCAFMAAPCSLGRFPFLVIAGETSYEGETSHLEFNGSPGYDCYVDAPSADDITGGRDELEWRGQCETAAGGQCRASGGFHGLQLFFESDEPDPCAAPAENAVSTIGCNGGFESGDPAAGETLGECTIESADDPTGTCTGANPYCSVAEGEDSGTCLELCTPASTYVTTGGCPEGYRCFTLGSNGICFRDCDASNPCPTGYGCDAEGSCILES